MVRIFTCISVAILLIAAACKKGNPVEKQSFGFLQLQLVLLPGSSTLDIYLENSKLSDSLVPGPMDEAKRTLVAAGKETRISFRKKGTAVILLDTTIVFDAGQVKKLRMAISGTLGVKRFLEETNSFGLDSASFQLFNNLPEVLQADSLQVDAVLCRLHPVTGEFEELTVFENFKRTQLHPKSVIVPLNENGVPLTYFFRFRNVKTGAFLIDGIGQDLVMTGFTPGKAHIFPVDGMILDMGGGDIFYLFNIEPAVL